MIRVVRGTAQVAVILAMLASPSYGEELFRDLGNLAEERSAVLSTCSKLGLAKLSEETDRLECTSEAAPLLQFTYSVLDRFGRKNRIALLTFEIRPRKEANFELRLRKKANFENSLDIFFEFVAKSLDALSAPENEQIFNSDIGDPRCAKGGVISHTFYEDLKGASSYARAKEVKRIDAVCRLEGKWPILSLVYRHQVR